MNLLKNTIIAENCSTIIRITSTHSEVKLLGYHMSEVLEILQRHYRKHYFVFFVVPKNMKMFDIVSSNNNTKNIFHKKFTPHVILNIHI